MIDQSILREKNTGKRKDGEQSGEHLFRTISEDGHLVEPRE